MIYTDGLHLIADSIPELNEFALSIGMKAEWFQDKPGRPHYDILSRKRLDRALELGAQMVPSKVIVQLLRYQQLSGIAQQAEVELDGWATSYYDSQGNTPEIQTKLLNILQHFRPDPNYKHKPEKNTNLFSE